MIIDLCRINLWIPESQSSITCHWIKFLCRTNCSNWVITGESMQKFVKILLPKDTRVHKVGRPWPWRSLKPWMHGGCSHVGMNPAGKPCSSGGPALEVQEISWRISDIVVKGTKDQEMSGDIGICWSFFKIPRGILKSSDHEHINSIHKFSSGNTCIRNLRRWVSLSLQPWPRCPTCQQRQKQHWSDRSGGELDLPMWVEKQLASSARKPRRTKNDDYYSKLT